MEVGRLGTCLPGAVRPLARRQLVRYRHRGLRAADTLLVSYPKSGSTWLRFLLAHALTGYEADFDTIRNTVPPLARHRRAPTLLPGNGRIIRSHEQLRPYHRRLGQSIIYLVRDGRDVALSYLDYLRRDRRFVGDVTTFVDLFLDGKVDGYGAWHEHVLAGLQFAEGSKAAFALLRYEDLRADPTAELARTLAFLGAEPKVPLAEVVASNTKERMRAKESTSVFLAQRVTDGTPFVRPDRAQGWEHLVPRTARARFERRCAAALSAAGYEGSVERNRSPEDR